MRTILYVFMGIGCLVVLLGLAGRRRWNARLDRERVRATGRVVDLVKNPNGGAFLAVIAFLADGEERRVQWKQPASGKRLAVGDEVELLYDPDRPERFHLAEEEDAGTHGATMQVGVIIIVTILGVMIYANVKTGQSPFSLAGPSGGEKQPASQKAAVEASESYRFFNGPNKQCTLTGYSGDAEAVTVPIFGEDRIVTEIGMGAFAGQRKLREVTVPGTVRRIATSAFSACLRLERVNLREGVEEIGPGAFDKCASLQDVTLPASLTDISTLAFPEDCGAVFHVVAGSYAEAWCQARGFRAEASDADGV